MDNLRISRVKMSMDKGFRIRIMPRPVKGSCATSMSSRFTGSIDSSSYEPWSTPPHCPRTEMNGIGPVDFVQRALTTARILPSTGALIVASMLPCQ